MLNSRRVQASRVGNPRSAQKKLSRKENEAKEEDGTHHTSVIPLTGFSPFSHEGHRQDLGTKLASLPGTTHVGISSKADWFSSKERASILQRQWGGDHKTHVVKSAGETVRRAYDSLPSTANRRALHLLVGHDRKAFAHGLKKSLMAGKIPEMEGRTFDEIHIHHPDDGDRSHGMSGTRMRQAVADGNFDEFHRHLGPKFAKPEAKRIFDKFQKGIKAGAIKVKRPMSESFHSFLEFNETITQGKLK